jgi:hypothetical protein
MTKLQPTRGQQHYCQHRYVDTHFQILSCAKVSRAIRMGLAGKGRRVWLPKSIAFKSACGLPFLAKNPEIWWLIRERVANVSI